MCLRWQMPRQRFYKTRRITVRLPASAQGLALFLLIVVLYSVASSNVVPFIYYQF